MNQFLHDMVHMTEGEKLIHYWWLWLVIGCLCAVVIYIRSGKNGK
ncbi:Uncharacterised protein [Listeria newyorkensis]|nr:Uncharacterised protein [Listeria newyorkensis]